MTDFRIVHDPELGELTALPGSPPGEQFWQGTFRYRDADLEVESHFYLGESGAVDTPTESLLRFARDVMAEIEAHIATALERLRTELVAAPERFGLDARGAEALAARGIEGLPFSLPEPTFYRPGDWQMRFAQCGLPVCETLGVAVIFSGTTPTEVDDLHASTPID